MGGLRVIREYAGLNGALVEWPHEDKILSQGDEMSVDVTDRDIEDLMREIGPHDAVIGPVTELSYFEAAVVYAALRELQERRKNDCRGNAVPDPRADLPRSMGGEASFDKDLYIHAGAVLAQVAEANSRAEAALNGSAEALRESKHATRFACKAGQDVEGAISDICRAMSASEQARSCARLSLARTDRFLGRVEDLEKRIEKLEARS